MMPMKNLAKVGNGIEVIQHGGEEKDHVEEF